MSSLGILALRWLLHAGLVMASVALVSPHNRSNTLGRALLVTVLVAVLVTPFAYFWFLIIPGLIALFAWSLVYALAYGTGIGRSLLAGLLQAALGAAVDLLFIRGRLG
ncbi:MAG: hypothetical protein NVSMB23_26220 [Myxococcales bacterium]